MRVSIGAAGTSAGWDGGQLLHGVLGLLAFAASFGAVWLAWQALAAGKVAEAVFAGGFAVLMTVFTRCCWSH